MYDLTGFLTSAGPWILAIVGGFVFIETGLLFPFLPGDSLVFTAALLSTTIGVPTWLIVITAAVAAILGDQVGYVIGERNGRRLFKPSAKVFKPRYRDQADAFLEKYGPPAVVLARFVPIVRTFLPPIAGLSTLRYRTFLIWNVSGGIAWATVLGIAGYFLGRINVIANNIELISVVIVVLSVIPIVVGIFRERRRSRATKDSQSPTTH